MKRFLLLLSCFTLFCCIIVLQPPTCKSEALPIEQNDWKLIWNDEFNGKTIDATKWQLEVDASGGGNNELEYYTDRPVNSYVKDGCLVIQAQKENYSQYGLTREYTSARLNTKSKANWLYGRIDVRAKLPRGKGLWPAIWMLPTEETYGEWASSGEIDIMESLGHETKKVYGTLHYGDKYPKNEHSGTFYTASEGYSEDFSNDFHIFRLDWDREEIRWYVDDKLYQMQTKWNTVNGEYPAPFDRPFYLILNLAVGGNWPGNPDDKIAFPQRMMIDYVRVYENTTIPEPTNTTPKPTSTAVLVIPTPKPITTPCTPYKINEEYIPSGYMGDYNNISQHLSWTEKPHTTPDCIRASYTPGPNKFGGVYWQNLPNNWGEKPGNDLSNCKITKCTFWAKGTTGREVIEFICGGINDDQKRYHDSFKVRKVINLTMSWQQYELNLEGKDLSSVIGGFCWVVASDACPGGAVFYLDDIQYE